MSESDQLDREDFRGWLQSYPPDEVIGRKCHTRGCPMAHYLWYWVGQPDPLGDVPYVEFGETGSRWLFRGRYYELPEWANKFARKVDGQSERYVTAKLALEILAQVPTVQPNTTPTARILEE